MSERICSTCKNYNLDERLCATSLPAWVVDVLITNGRRAPDLFQHRVCSPKHTQAESCNCFVPKEEPNE